MTLIITIFDVRSNKIKINLSWCGVIYWQNYINTGYLLNANWKFHSYDHNLVLAITVKYECGLKNWNYNSGQSNSFLKKNLTSVASIYPTLILCMAISEFHKCGRPQRSVANQRVEGGRGGGVEWGRWGSRTGAKWAICFWTLKRNIF